MNFTESKKNSPILTLNFTNHASNTKLETKICSLQFVPSVLEIALENYYYLSLQIIYLYIISIYQLTTIDDSELSAKYSVEKFIFSLGFCKELEIQ